MSVLWSKTVAATVSGLSTARENGGLLVRADDRVVLLAARDGSRRAEWKGPAPLTAASSADVGHCHAVGARDGRFWLLGSDLAPLREHTLPGPIQALALDPHGQYLAVSDGQGLLHLLDREGRSHWQLPMPRPLRRLAFVPERPLLVGAADFGVIVCLNITGHALWRDRPMTHIGSLAVSGDGARIALACYSDGLMWYAHNQGNPRHVAGSPASQAALSYDGRSLLTIDLAGEATVQIEGGAGRVLPRLGAEAAGLALGPLGTQAFLALADGTVLALDCTPG